MKGLDLMVEKLDKLYVCSTCGATFLFKDDCRDHREQAGHLDGFEEMVLTD